MLILHHILKAIERFLVDLLFFWKLFGRPIDMASSRDDDIRNLEAQWESVHHFTSESITDNRVKTRCDIRTTEYCLMERIEYGCI